MWLRNRRRAKIRLRPFPEAWETILHHTMPYYRRLNPEDRRELQGHILVFCAEKRFEGAGGLRITDDIRVTIAAGACLLLLHRTTDYYPTLNTIVVYPHAYRVSTRHSLPGGVVEERLETRLGESWYRGEVVLSWDDVRRGAADIHDGHNVVLHEFAHQLDAEYGPTDGVPDLPRRSLYAPWARVLGEEYEHLVQDIHAHRPSFLDAYGGTNPAEFFAVVTETFFEQPHALYRHNPELYDLLMAFYRQDPRERE